MDQQIIARYNNTILHEAMQRYGESSRSIIKTGISSDVIISMKLACGGVQRLPSA
jgi:hypothetical protein